MNKKLIYSFLLLILFSLPLTARLAAGDRPAASVYVGPEEIVAGNLYAVGQEVVVDGQIAGDLIALSQSLTVNGRVEGDIIAAAAEITVAGEVGGNVRAAGSNITIDAGISRNVNIIANRAHFGNGADIGWDLLLIAKTAELRGRLNGSLNARAESLLLGGRIAKDVRADLLSGQTGSGLTLEPGAEILGRLTYSAPSAAKIAEAAIVSGGVSWTETGADEKSAWPAWLIGRLYAILSSFIVGLVLVFMFHRITAFIQAAMMKNPGRLFLPGIALMFLLPLVSILLLITLIGIPLALVLLAWWMIMIYLAKIIAAIFIGRWLTEKMGARNLSPAWPLLLGITIICLLTAIPYVGSLVCLVAIWFGLGGIWSYASHQLRHF